MDRARQQGFTLIELLIVVGILGLLAAAFLPDIIGAGEAAKVTSTRTLLTQLAVGCESFERQYGFYPPDDLQDPENKLQFKTDNGQNTGIESLVAFLSQSRAAGADLSNLGEQLTNTDKDDHGAMLPVLNRRERLEVADAWGTPLAYFSKTSKSGGFAKPQTITLPGDTGDTVRAVAAKNQDGMPVGNGKFQLLSAGHDKQFGTADDISFPEK